MLTKSQRDYYFPRIKQLLSASVIILVALHLIFQTLRSMYPDVDFIVDLSNRFNVDDEVSLPTWYSVSLLLSLSGASFWLYKTKGHTKYWKYAALLFGLMSIDEGSGFHELLITPIRGFLEIEGESLAYNAWILVGIIVVSVLGVLGAKFIGYLKTNVAKKHLIIGFCFYVSGIIILEAIGGLFIDDSAIYRTWVVLIEELLELTGLTFMAFALIEEMDATD